MSDQPQKPSEQKRELSHTLGIAGGMAKEFIHSPLSILLLLASLAIGIMGLLFTPRQEDPQISVPMVDVFFSYPGASAEQVSSLAIDPLERLMSEIPGVEHVYSVARHGGGMVTVQFTVGEVLETSLVKLYDKLMSNMDKIPPGVSQPLVKPKGVDDVPVVTLTLWSHDVDDAALRLVALDVMQRLKEVPNTSQSFIVGGRAEELRVEVFPERLAGYGVSVGQLAKTITSANSETDAGMVESAGNSLQVYTGSFLTKPEDVERLIIGVHNGSPVYVRDVAMVSQAPEVADDLVQYFTGPAYKSGEVLAPVGAPAVTIAVAKKVGSNGVSVAEGVLSQVDYLKGRIIPDNVEVSVTRNYGKTANDKVNELIFKLFVATAAVTALIWIFLGVRAAVVVLIVIPVVILVTVFSAWILGFTIDRVSLFALIFSIGILVDDAIVVIENIYRRWLMKGDVDTETSVDAVAEVGNPTILATFTVIAALMPMGFVSGMMGPYMAPIPVLGSVAMIFSLFAAFIFTPWLAMRIRPSMDSLKKSHKKEEKQQEWLDGFFRKTLIPLIESKVKYRIFRLTMLGILFACFALFYTTSVTVKMLPLDNKPEFNVVVNMPEGTALPVTANVIQAMTDKLLTLPEVTAIQTYSGTASPFNFNGLVRHYYLREESWQGDIQIQLLDKSERERSSHDLAVAAREMLTPLAKELGAKIQVVEMPPGPPVLQTMVAEVYGPDAETRRQVARDLTAKFAEATNVVDEDNLIQDQFEAWHFIVDREKAIRRGVSVEDINMQLEMVMGSYKLGDVKIGNILEPRYIVMQIPISMRDQFSRLGQLPIPSTSGSMIPLSELGRFERVQQDHLIFHKDLRPVEFVTGEVAGRLAAPIYGMFEVEDLLVDYVTPDGVKLEANYISPPEGSFKSGFEWTGEWTVTYETFRDMGLAFGVALVLIYMLVMWEFGNFKLPAIIMAPIPLTLIGIIPGHWLFGAEFTATSMIGFIALAGIIVRNSILLADFSKRLVEEGVPVTEAVIEACRARTRPIMITALALVAGSSVILSDPIFQGMAISLMFGVMVSTLLTLVVIPLKCATIDPKKVYGCASGVKGIEADFECAVHQPANVVGVTAAAPAQSGGKIRLLWVIPAMIGIFAWTAVVTLVQWIGRWKIFKKIVPILSMAFYALRALPYFVMLFVKDTFGRMFARKAVEPAPVPTPAPAPTPTPAPKVEPKPEPKPDPMPEPKVEPKLEQNSAPKVDPKPEPKPEVKAEPKPVQAPKPQPEAKAEEVKKEPEAKKAPVKKVAAKKVLEKKAPVEKVTVKKSTTKKSVTKKATAKKVVVKKAPAKKVAVKKTTVSKKPETPKPTPRPRPKAKRRGIRLKNIPDTNNDT
ncbi:MAG: efflux RND transporter permease subunit [Magnetovibrio sp.]|nr:efflux RND transporter permease subunit [Magnetovibrio sp.]